MTELNPNHPVVDEMRGQWHKIVAILMARMGADEVVITPVDVEDALSRPGGINVVADTRGGGHQLTLRLVSDAEAHQLARAAGGLPV